MSSPNGVRGGLDFTGKSSGLGLAMCGWRRGGRTVTRNTHGGRLMKICLSGTMKVGLTKRLMEMTVALGHTDGRACLE